MSKKKKTDGGDTGPMPLYAPAPEKVVARIRPHVRVLFWPTILLFAVCAVTGFYAGNLPEPWQNTLLLLGAALVILVGWLLPLAFWLTHRYTVTTRRIIFRRGFFVRTRQELVHSRGYEVTVRQTWLQSLWRSGTVSINTGLKHPLVISDIPNAELVQQVLNDLMHESRSMIGTSRQEQWALSPETSGWGRS
ncbi:PH domain-containing protein [Cryobacterium sp. CG_9.6]|uniref:PH domain-containing protein n=1 Tax=Cryobacterium sp. CG_9.6 TaxID=2760710 RepID=UPI0024734279|nr:PH domain-containing protein [Cryobacterium sp. CG_9.6]MDH6235925.1 membrane protein YdbS with pleckstrin-like domain [Cryobacterium sp. CG_9.6]